MIKTALILTTLVISLLLCGKTSFASDPYSYEKFQQNYAKTHARPIKIQHEKTKASTQATWIAFKNPTHFNETLAAGLLILCLYLWYVKHQQPTTNNNITPSATPPETIDPAGLRHLINKRYDSRTFTTALLTLKHKKALTIAYADSHYHLAKTSESPKLTTAESRLMDQLFDKRTTITLSRTSFKALSVTITQHQQQLAHEIIPCYLIKNTGHRLAGIACSLLLCFGGIYQQTKQSAEPVTTLLLASLPFLMVTLLILLSLQLAQAFWRHLSTITTGKPSLLALFLQCGLLLFTLSFTLSWSHFIIKESSLLTPFLLAIIIVINRYAGAYLCSYTPAGVTLRDQAFQYLEHLKSHATENSPYLIAFNLPNAEEAALDRTLHSQLNEVKNWRFFAP